VVIGVAIIQTINVRQEFIFAGAAGLSWDRMRKLGVGSGAGGQDDAAVHYGFSDKDGRRTMNDRSDGELLGMLLELISTTAGIARMALGDAADQRPHSYLRRWLAEAATRFAMASSARTMLDQVTIPPEQRALIVALLEAVEGVSL